MTLCVIKLRFRCCRIDRSRWTYKWYIRIDRKCIAWAMFNAYIIEEKFRQRGRKRDFRQFQLEVIHQLVGENRFRSRKFGRPASTDNVPARTTDTPHMPSVSGSKDHRCLRVCRETQAVQSLAPGRAVFVLCPYGISRHALCLHCVRTIVQDICCVRTVVQDNIT